AGVPLRSPEVLLGYLRGTATPSGLAVTAEWWERTYAKGVKVSDAEMASLEIEHHDICPRGNYTIRPRHSHRWNWGTAVACRARYAVVGSNVPIAAKVNDRELVSLW